MRERILACACDLYLTDGLDGFSMRKLARSLGVTAPALYKHYASKERVLLDVVGEAYRQLIQYLHQALQGRTPEERFRLAGQGYLEFALQHPRYYEVLFMGVELLRVDDVPEEITTQGCAVGQFWNDRVRECIEAGMLREGDPEGIGMALWSHAHGLISLYLKGMLAISEEQMRALYQASGARVLMGLGTEAYAARLRELLTEAHGNGANGNGTAKFNGSAGESRWT
jgi:AcrR family transcriptional regulator